MQYRDLRDFIRELEKRGELKRIQTPVSPVLEMTEICDRTLRKGGPALLFEQPTGFAVPVLGNLFGTPQRVALGMGAEDVGALRLLADDITAVVTVADNGGSSGRLRAELDAPKEVPGVSPQQLPVARSLVGTLLDQLPPVENIFIDFAPEEGGGRFRARAALRERTR